MRSLGARCEPSRVSCKLAVRPRSLWREHRFVRRVGGDVVDDKNRAGWSLQACRTGRSQTEKTRAERFDVDGFDNGSKAARANRSRSTGITATRSRATEDPCGELVGAKALERRHAVHPGSSYGVGRVRDLEPGLPSTASTVRKPWYCNRSRASLRFFSLSSTMSTSWPCQGRHQRAAFAEPARPPALGQMCCCGL